MPKPKPKPTTAVLEIVEPIGNRVLIRKDQDKKVTKVGIHLPDKLEIPTLTGRIVAISAQVENDVDYPIHRHFLWSKALELQHGGAGATASRLGRELARTGPGEE